ncbi:MAG: YceI family protein [Flavisolibacter sp.]|nr:YceI family protein [Flavisolibacter sp.]
MNSKLSIICLTLIITPLFFSCRGTAKKENTTEASASAVTSHTGNEKYIPIDTKESVVEWKGSNSFGTHEGYVSISKGELIIENGQLRGGSAVVNMNTIVDEQHSGDNGLIQHLKNPDFFDVEKYPGASIAITRVAEIKTGEIEVTANLTIKGIANTVTFPAKIEIKDEIVKADGSFIIDRTNWGIRYKSGKFFDLLADKTISDYIEFKVKIVAKK